MKCLLAAAKGVPDHWRDWRPKDHGPSVAQVVGDCLGQLDERAQPSASFQENVARLRRVVRARLTEASPEELNALTDRLQRAYGSVIVLHDTIGLGPQRREPTTSGIAFRGADPRKTLESQAEGRIHQLVEAFEALSEDRRRWRLNDQAPSADDVFAEAAQLPTWTIRAIEQGGMDWWDPDFQAFARELEERPSYLEDFGSKLRGGFQNLQEAARSLSVEDLDAKVPAQDRRWRMRWSSLLWMPYWTLVATLGKVEMLASIGEGEVA